MKIKCLVMCRNANGEPDCVPVIVECTEAEYNEGDHYDAAEGICMENGYEAPFLTFDENDASNLARQFQTDATKLLKKVDWEEADET